jgi:hypothetical protein
VDAGGDGAGGRKGPPGRVPIDLDAGGGMLEKLNLAAGWRGPVSCYTKFWASRVGVAAGDGVGVAAGKAAVDGAGC